MSNHSRLKSKNLKRLANGSIKVQVTIPRGDTATYVNLAKILTDNNSLSEFLYESSRMWVEDFLKEEKRMKEERAKAQPNPPATSTNADEQSVGVTSGQTETKK